MKVDRRRRGASDAQQAFLDQVDPHLEALRNIARGLVRDRDHAEDLFQDTCMRAYAGFGRWRGGDVRSWLVAIMLNSLRMDLRRARSRPVECLDERVDQPCEERSVESAALAAIDRDVIVSALGGLPELARICVVLTDLGGLTAQEVADLLGCPRGTVLARVHRARRTLAQRIDHRVGTS